ncbi:MAG: leucine dehydrogenase [Candidatus Marinimicrobia bacterium]|nr:leucine dehydrogenase [Candidatus Neomarinimicrobiota bacterium]|tara:strand:+ start:1177 stop:2250 length:1074 start_codon:yes stop_codon:yes gene_type:complete
MKVFDQIKSRGHEQVTYFHDPLTNLKAIVAIHSTVLGPSLGGCRMMKYESDDLALIDVLRLSKGMTYKAAISNLKLGGGKSVIIGDPRKTKSRDLLESFGSFIEGLNGRYITAEDMGTTVQDMEIIKNKTDYVTGMSELKGGSGDPSNFTSYGTYIGIKAAVSYKLKKDNLDGLSIFVQGLGSVGEKLISYLSKHDIKIYIDDIDKNKIESCVFKYNAIDVSDKDIYSLDVDIYSPCAIGATINDSSINKLKCKIVAGAANNILDNYDKHGKLLFKKGILYAPDYVINAGGLINIYNELGDYDKNSVFSQVDNIYDTLMDVFYKADELGLPTNIISDMIAEEKIKKEKFKLDSGIKV